MNNLNRFAWAVLLAALAAGLLGACALGGGQSTYRLLEPQLGALELDNEAPLDAALAVGRPKADRTRDSSRILVREGRTIRPWAGVAWIDRAPELVRTLLIESLDGRVAALGREGEFAARYRLELELRRFELARDAGGLRADFVLSARLIDALGRSQGSLTIHQSNAGAGDGNVDAAVAAMEQVMETAFTRLGNWLHGELAPVPD